MKAASEREGTRTEQMLGLYLICLGISILFPNISLLRTLVLDIGGMWYWTALYTGLGLTLALTAGYAERGIRCALVLVAIAALTFVSVVFIWNKQPTPIALWNGVMLGYAVERAYMLWPPLVWHPR